MPLGTKVKCCVEAAVSVWPFLTLSFLMPVISGQLVPLAFQRDYSQVGLHRLALRTTKPQLGQCYVCVPCTTGNVQVVATTAVCWCFSWLHAGRSTYCVFDDCVQFAYGRQWNGLYFTQILVSNSMRPCWCELSTPLVPHCTCQGWRHPGAEDKAYARYGIS